ncbi:PBS lyase [Desulfovibrio mangrovi]|uniref:PBS lyase n=1 Tax=Desulfovibrio mangrovi TaxID=2976983 RepID=UPI002248652D|nr:PBS lyase [Desulfovibrio mangrovi]UZP67558.1 PBS lyase [Desulfovibrio mangrovi]
MTLPISGAELVLFSTAGMAARMTGGRRDRLRSMLADGPDMAFPMLRVKSEDCAAVLLCCSMGQDLVYLNGLPVGIPARAMHGLGNMLKALWRTAVNAPPVSLADEQAVRLDNMLVLRLPSSMTVAWENVLKLRMMDVSPMLLPVFSDMAALEKALDAMPEGAVGGEYLALNAQGNVVRRFKDTELRVSERTESVERGVEDRIHALGLALTRFVVPEGSCVPVESGCQPQRGDVWSFFDPQDGGFRLWGWRWDTGIVLEALAVAARESGDTAILDAAIAVGNRMLGCQLTAPDCAGGFPEWVDFRYSESDSIITEWVAPFNAAFIAAGLGELADTVGGAEGARYASAAAAGYDCLATKGLTGQGGLFGYYFTSSGRWQYLGQINDSFIAGRGLSRCAVESREHYAAIAARMALYMTGKAQQPDGHVRRAWHDPVGAAPVGAPLFPEWNEFPDRVVEKIFLRGQAWALFGLAGVCRLLRGLESDDAVCIRERTATLVRYLLQVQRENGSWLYSQLQEELGECVKGTAAIASALAEYAAVTGDSTVLSAIRRALDYLERSSAGNVVPSSLAVLPMDSSEEGGIIYYRNRPMVCAYAGALELLARVRLARLEETA